MKKRYLYNQKNKKELIKLIKKENFTRITCSFYRYIHLNNLELLRDELYLKLNNLDVLGRIYIAQEGINAQVSIPEDNLKYFNKYFNGISQFKKLHIKQAVQEGESFYKLVIKIKEEIVAYKIPSNEYDMTKVGKHLNYKEYNQAIDQGATMIDMRNYYEGEIGKFENAIILDIDTSRDLLPEVKKLLEGQKNNKILLYCTGGIRCEKASSYLIFHGFTDVNQLNGGIIQYAQDIKKHKAKSKFIGKNFVFDHRLGERITKEVISNCHQCKIPADTHINCSNQSCHILFIQCKSCSKKYDNCCSTKCKQFNLLPINEQKKLFKSGKLKFTSQSSNRIKPKLI